MDDWRNALNTSYIERLYADFSKNPESVPSDWRNWFERLAEGASDNHHSQLGPSFRPASIFRPPSGGDRAVLDDKLHLARLQERFDILVRNYRFRGHIIARVDPLGRQNPRPFELDLDYYGISEADLDSQVSTKAIRGSNVQTLREVIQRLEESYCGAIGAQFMHIDELETRRWLQRRMENRENRLRLNYQQQVRILTKLTDAVIFEEFVRTKYVGMKTFSLEGAETLIPLLDLAIEKLALQGVREIVMGMAHRGRLNVLANILGKHYHDIFREFEDVDPVLYSNRGDVKYHLGYHNYCTTATGHEVHISLGFNPSHLEFVNPVTLGRCRAKQDRFGDSQRKVAAALLIHGDAAFAGEGIVQETLNLSQLSDYAIGGTIHVIVNNQIGFTTPPGEGRSCAYATDVAKMLQIPIFHVNGEDPEAVAQVVDMALDFRATFRRDVIIDMYSFRRWGHNEGDEPAFTQPLMYEAIEKRPTVREGYLNHLMQLGMVTKEAADDISQRRYEILEQELSLARRDDYSPKLGTLESMWQGYMGQEERFVEDVDTAVEREDLSRYMERLASVPDGFHVHPKLRRVLNNRRAMATGEKPLDWASGELLALATVAAEGYRVRFSGQDSQRGTFSQRHAVLHDTTDGRTYTALQHISPDQAAVEVVNSPLSEAGVLGYEYGYSLVFPDGLVMWEAQFGDFANAAQVIIDQFIASAEDKWRHLSGLVMLLPHGFEGQGPEHSSARLERFLVLAAEDNMQIVMPSTPAQHFHALRRQVVRRWRKPLVVFTPKSLLRHPLTVSDLDEFATGRFRRVLPDSQAEPERVRRVLLCSGKMYYDLEEARRKRQRSDVALVRIEQFYPLPDEQVLEALKAYGEGTPVYWVQEEPENMGAWSFLRWRLGEKLQDRYPFAGVTRPASASPATGSSNSHRLEQQEVIDQAFGEPT
ncbi:MAG: 2-oxoglutarate dehydrogenase E1 component [Pirellulaceae bacterium]|nr:2-oxoglutarate dehydrogenase E1 component [Pirellulaceae bacterium]